MLLEKAAGVYGTARVKLMDVTVKSVNKEERYCIVNSLDGTQNIDGLKVRLALEICDGDLDYPEERSTITIAFTDFTEPYMVSATWLSQKTVIVGNQAWDIIDGKQTFNDGAYGGIPIVKDPANANNGLTKHYNDIEKKLNDLITVFNSWTPVPNDGGAALKTALATWVAQNLTLTQEADISNPNIVHGKTLS